MTYLYELEDDKENNWPTKLDDGNYYALYKSVYKGDGSVRLFLIPLKVIELAHHNDLIIVKEKE